MRAIIYARASLDLTGEGRSVERQMEACQALAVARGWSVVATEQDNSISATSGKTRPAWQRVLAAIEAGDVDVVIAWHIDRMTRSMRDLEVLIDLAEKHGVGIATAVGDIDLTTDAGRMVARILAAVARAEVERKAARQKLAHRQLAEQGKPWTGGRRPLGYNQDQSAVVQAEADALLWGAQHVLEGGLVSEVQREWKRRGIERTLGGVKRALTSPRYIGKRQYKGQVAGEATWPAIFTEELYESVCAVLKAPGRSASASMSSRRRQSLLSGIATCSRCGSGLTTTNRKGVKHYTCSSPQRCLTVRADLIEQKVIEETVGLLSSTRVLSVIAGSDADLDAMVAEADSLRDRLDVVGESFTEGTIDADMFRSMSGKLTARLREVEDDLKRAGTGAALDGLNVGLPEVVEQWNGLSLDRQRAVIDALFEVVAMPANEKRGGQTRWSPDLHLDMGRPSAPTLVE